MTSPGKLDVHAHYLPEPYRRALGDAGHSQPDGMPQIPAWSAEEHVALMDRLGIATSLLSVSSPGVHLTTTQAATRDLAREVNEAGRRAVVDHPDRFGLLGSLPLPDVDAAIAEIAHCVDTLHVDGFVLLTNVGGTYLGDRTGTPSSASSTGAAPVSSSTRRRRCAGTRRRSGVPGRCWSSCSTPPGRW